MTIISSAPERMSEFVPVATEETEEEPAEGDEFDTGLEDFDVGGDI